MPVEKNNTVRVAILDLYAGEPNQGLPCIRRILSSYAIQHNITLVTDEYEVRLSENIPGLDYDIYISTGGPGSPLDSRGSNWEKLYFNWIRSVETFNRDDRHTRKKHVLFICHSFQLACRYFNLGQVAKRRSTAFGIMPVHIVEDGQQDPLFTGLEEIFYALESRDYQVIRPDMEKIRQAGASVLAIEKERPHVPLERAIMALRFNDYMLGTQFHPEAEAETMIAYLQREHTKENVIGSHGLDKWQSMIDHLNDPGKISWTYERIIPNFLEQATGEILRNDL